MNHRFGIFLIMAALQLPAIAHADAQRPFTYSRAHIAISRQSLPPVTQLPWQEEPSMEESPNIGFDVEIRDAEVFNKQQGWFNLNGMSENNGILLLFGAPSMAPVTHSLQYAPLDILLIDSEGNVARIVPNIKLSELEQNISPVRPVLAFLFLKGGTCQKKSINPGDIVEYAAFKQPPVIMDKPAPSAPDDSEAVKPVPLLPPMPPLPNKRVLK